LAQAPETNKDKLEQQRKDKLSRIRELGVDPYGGRYEKSESAESIKNRFIDDKKGQRAKCAGRIILLRDIGKLIFITLRDWSGTIQIGLSKKMLADNWKLTKLLELGDVIGTEGQLGRTRTGEITIWSDDIVLLSKSLLQPPEKFHGLADIDQRYRQRYIDLWANPEVMSTFKKRSAIISEIRNVLQDKGFLEVETPMMQAIAGGAAAKPFVTHHNTLDMDLYLRIAPELFLKRLLVGGMEKVFEINRNFRNEGISRQHNPEFTMLELYQAYGDYNDMMDLTERLICSLVKNHCESEKIEFNGQEIDFSQPWNKASYTELLKEYSGCDIDDIDAIREKATQLEINHQEMDDAVVVNEVFEQTVEDSLINPTFVVDYPAEICPLTKPKKNNERFAERFELFIGGMELANAYTELNDPGVQEENFKKQLKGQQDTMATMDEDFITALKYGMPPAGGLGIGIDRLIMVLTGADSIREVILFPLLRHKS
jgi:lysyl-tRNA synthetase class 2